MDTKLLLVIIALLAFAGPLVHADIYFDRLSPRLAEMQKSDDYTCEPGRSYIVMDNENKPDKSNDEDDDDEDEDGRRTHMNSGIREESCLICLCSLDGKEKHCSRRPARNVNECIRMATIAKEQQKNEPYDHQRLLSYRIRRDYVWHRDEIPYDSHAKCERGVTYYSNSPIANDTDLTAAAEVVSLISYNTTDVCYYCVCSVDGEVSGCIARDPWYCQYYRFLRDPVYSRDRYSHYLRQDRPAYFRSLSYRMRRTMDDGAYDFLAVGGDALCCEHPNGHRKNLHKQVRNKIHQLRFRVPKENILDDTPDRNGDYVDFIVNND